MSALPKQVKAMVDEANRIAEEIKKAQTPEPAAPEGTPPVEPPPANAPAQPTEPTPTPPAPTPTPPAPAPAPAPVSADEQRYRVLQGKYNAEVPRLQQQVRELIERNRLLEQQVTSQQMLTASLHQNRAPDNGARHTPTPTTKLVKDEEVREFGEDLFDFVSRAARQAVLPEVEARLQPMTQKVEQVSQSAAQAAAETAETKKQRVHSLLDKDVPKWQEQNENEQFLDWLAQADPFSGRVRGELLSEAYGAHDGPRVVSFFKGFLNENAIVAPTPPAPPKGGSQRSLADYVAPGTAKPGTTGAPNEAGKRTWSEAEIGQFYTDVRQGKYRGRPADQRAIEQDIFAAQAEGRVRIR